MNPEVKRHIKTGLVAVLLSVLALIAAISCSDWTDMESLPINSPSDKEQNPGLYAQYVQALNAYKQSDHQVTIATFNNIGDAVTTSRSQHLTDLPDSLDYICLNHVMAVNPTNVAEIGEVRKLGTRVLGLVDFDAIASAWNALVDDYGESDGDEGDGDDETTRFIRYCRDEVGKQLSACADLGLDGVVANYSGTDLNMLVDPAAIAAETARQGAFFDTVAQWAKEKQGRFIIFKGYPQNVIGKQVLADCRYIIVNAHSAKNRYEMSYLVQMALTPDVPADRVVIGTTTPYRTDSGSDNGEFADGSSAIIGAAQWTVAAEEGYAKAGIAIDGAEQDYFNYNNVYPHIKEAINILNPNH
ncbi:MAG: glycoside hydrolase family 18 [Mediterranea sp.]|jgi:hypothetical protein|nr:glycoside hydrolase family 18 [Mediterranea sp.]